MRTEWRLRARNFGPVKSATVRDSSSRFVRFLELILRDDASLVAGKRRLVPRRSSSDDSPWINLRIVAFS